KCMGKRNWGRMPQVLERLDRAAGRGIRISFDQYPYDASSTTLSMLLPAWAMEGGVDGFRNCTADADSRGKVLAHLRAAIERRGGPQSIRIASAPCADGTFLAGKDLKAIAEAWKSAAEEAVLRILQETQLSAIAIYHAMSSEDVELAMRHPLHSVGSDGVLGEHPHPRAYGTFPRIIGHYHARQGLFTL
ncbi:MAG: hypothetical protein MUF04_13360, partial [Akkermansiaceae bacterium]|nr:hypothetical protein [Akkermansiaceae bacterium]